jgi:hypothetical protein
MTLLVPAKLRPMPRPFTADELFVMDFISSLRGLKNAVPELVKATLA